MQWAKKSPEAVSFIYEPKRSLFSKSRELKLDQVKIKDSGSTTFKIPKEAKSFEWLIIRPELMQKDLECHLTIESGLYQAKKPRLCIEDYTHSYLAYDILPSYFYYQKFDFDKDVSTAADIKKSVTKQLDAESRLYADRYSVIHFERHAVYESPVSLEPQQRTLFRLDYK